MKKLLLFLLLSMPLVIIAQQQVPNSDFETWTDANHPNTWKNSITIQTQIGPVVLYTATRTTDHYQGQYSALLETKDNYGNITPGLIQLGDLTLDNNYEPIISGGIPFTEKPTGLSIYAKYFPVNSDSANIFLYLTKYNATTHKRDTLGGTIYFISDTIASYTQLTIPIVYWDSLSTPDSMNIIFIASSIFNSQVGSKLYLDSMNLMYEFYPYPTIASDATEITDSSFTANWYSSPLSDQYKFDLATDENFTNFVPSYENLSVAGSTIFTDTLSHLEISIPQAVTQKQLYYRVRINYADTALSDNSNTILVNIPSGANVAKINATINYIVKNNTLFFTNLKNDSYVEIYDLKGSLVQENYIKSPQSQINLKQKGLLLVRIKNKEITKTFKIYVD